MESETQKTYESDPHYIDVFYKNSKAMRLSKVEFMFNGVQYYSPYLGVVRKSECPLLNKYSTRKVDFLDDKMILRKLLNIYNRGNGT